MSSIMPLLVLILISFCFHIISSYKLGVGIYDVTGPATEVNFMGYAVPNQRGEGIHMRLRARSFVVSNNDKFIGFVSVDSGMGSDLVKMRVIEQLEAAVPGVFTNDNVCISGTHTHSGPAGFLQYVLFQLTSIGFVQETFDALVNGITQSLLMAYNTMEADVSIDYATGKMDSQSNINRSPTSYLLNPHSERDMYPDGDTDKDMVLLKFTSSSKQLLGAFNWFAVHATSMNNTNTLISSDNKGYASYSLEREYNSDGDLPGMGKFVAGCCSTNLGDVSPNTNGAKCIDSGEDCDGTTSTCHGRCENCIAFGPGTNGDMFESTQIIGNKQFEMAKSLIESTGESIDGDIDYRHTFVDMSALTIDGTDDKLCSPAMGYAFAAGTTDGPGMFNFQQGSTSTNPFWNRVTDFLSTPTDEEVACQAPKPILINTGDVAKPYEWDPKVVPIQILRIGNFFLLAVPAEFTTMSGRRIRKAIKEVIEQYDVTNGMPVYVTIAGLANSYSSYVTTYEEYQAQRYEAASTIFGPHTLQGYIQEMTRIAVNLATGNPSVSTVSPPDMTDVLIEMMPTPHPDRVPQNVSFGDVINDVNSQYNIGDTVSTTFWSANPRNNQRIQGTFLTVEKQSKLFTKVYDVYATDGDWETKFKWLAGKEDKFHFGYSRESYATIEWTIPSSIDAGVYRICHHGNHKLTLTDIVLPFSGCSSDFNVIA